MNAKDLVVSMLEAPAFYRVQIDDGNGRHNPFAVWIDHDRHTVLIETGNARSFRQFHLIRGNMSHVSRETIVQRIKRATDSAEHAFNDGDFELFWMLAGIIRGNLERINLHVELADRIQAAAQATTPEILNRGVAMATLLELQTLLTEEKT